MQTGIHYPIDLETLPVGWEKGYVGDFALEIQPGFASGKHNKEGRGISHIRPYNIDRLGKIDLLEIKSVDPDAGTKRLHSGDVLFNNTNSPELIGKTTVITAAGDWGFSNHMTRVAFSDTVSPKFAAYQLHYLWSRGYFLHNCVKHVNQASVSSTTLARAVPFVKPPRPQQDGIVAEIEKQFSRLDEAVANLKRVKSNLKRYKASVLKAAIEGKLTDDWRKKHPNVEPASKLLERILAQGPDRQPDRTKHKKDIEEDSGALFPLPKNWAWCKAYRLAEVIDPQPSHRTPEEICGGVPYIGMGDVSVQGTIDFLNARKVSKQILEEHRHRYQLRKGNFIFGKIGTLGAPVLLPEPYEYTLSANVVLFQPDSKIANPGFVLAYMRSPILASYLARMSKSTSQPAFGIQKVREIPIPLPPVEEQDEIVAEVERRLSVIDELEAAVQVNFTRAARLRQSILSRAFSGRLLGQEKMPTF